MKKLLLATIISGASLCAFAQPTMDFESWTANNGTFPVPEEPTGWVTGNQLVTFGNSTSVTKVTGSDAHAGYAMLITTMDVTSDPTGGKLPDPIGIAFAGKIQIAPLKLINGFSYTVRSTTCDFWYKYDPITGDSASCGVTLTKWNGIKRDTIAVGGVIIKSGVSIYTPATFSLTYLTNAIPDSMSIGFSATCMSTMTCGKIGSKLWIDDISFSGNNGINEQLSSEGVVVYPVPASDRITISVDALNDAFSVNAFDVTGKLVATAPLTLSNSAINRRSGMINTSAFSSGLYSYSVLDKNGVSLRAGKFNIAR